MWVMAAKLDRADPECSHHPKWRVMLTNSRTLEALEALGGGPELERQLPWGRVHKNPALVCRLQEAGMVGKVRKAPTSTVQQQNRSCPRSGPFTRATWTAQQGVSECYALCVSARTSGESSKNLFSNFQIILTWTHRRACVHLVIHWVW
jgi:hypothetical protein